MASEKLHFLIKLKRKLDVFGPTVRERYEIEPAPEHGVTRFNFPDRRTNTYLSYVVDYSALILMAAVGVTFSLARPPDLKFTLEDPSISYPISGQIISNQMVAVFTVGIPLILLLSTFFWTRSFRDMHQAFLGFMQSLLLTFTLTSFLWANVGGLRPVFLEVCNPNITLIRQPSYPGQVIYYGREICTAPAENAFSFSRATNTVEDALRGFPSGHASTAMACYTFLALYLAGKLRLYDMYSHMWKFTFIVLIETFGMWIGWTQYTRYRHTFFQVMFGMILGTLAAIVVYRFHYHSMGDGIAAAVAWKAKKPESKELVDPAPSGSLSIRPENNLPV